MPRSMRGWGESGCFNDPARADAAGADANFLDGAILVCAHTLKVRIEATFGHVVGMAHIIADDGFFSAYFTFFRHESISLSIW